MTIELLERVGIGDAVHAVDRYPGSFSGGMRQRAMIAKALSCKTTLGRAILRLIEPTGGRIIFTNGNGLTDIATLNRSQLRRQWRHMHRRVSYRKPSCEWCANG